MGQIMMEYREKGPCIFPSALKDGHCAYYASPEPQRVARGFRNLFDSAKALDVASMRAKLKHYLGGNGTYYLYRNGEKVLSEEQQSWIAQLFASYGYTEPLVFDSYESVVTFD